MRRARAASSGACGTGCEDVQAAAAASPGRPARRARATDPRRRASRTERRLASGAGATAPRVLLVEDLSAIGADVTDAEERAAQIKAAGGRVTWVAVAPPGARAWTADAGARARQLVAREHARPVLRSVSASASWDHVWLASAAPGGGPLARWLPRGARWWPTGLEPEAGPVLDRVLRRALGGPELPALDEVAARGSASLLAWSQVAPRASRPPALPLWDGDLVLAPEGLEGWRGTETLAAFATLAESWSGLDLVGWAHPDEGVEREARGMGIGMRVHHVGRPPRLAESSWWAQASAAIFSGASRISAGLVLRGLSAGCPMVWIAPQPGFERLARWLEQQGCASVVVGDASALADQVGRLLEREPEVGAAIERGRALAARHDSSALLGRVAGSLGLDRPISRAAA